MEFREPVEADLDAIREVAHASLHASYEDVLGEEAIHEALDRWYDVDDLAAEVADDDLLFLLADDGDEVAAFSQSHLRDATGHVQWLHVHPDRRGEGIATRLLAATREALAARGVERITGAVLAANEAGNEFYADHGFSMEDQITVSVGGKMYAENHYVDVAGAERDLVPVETPEGELYADEADPDRGRDAPFYPVYRSRDGTRRWGWQCGNCGSVDTAMDTMERVVCNDCGNVRKAARWDAAYL